MTKLKAPQKPQKPNKPVAPNKDQKHHKHYIDIEHFFIKETYYDDDGNEISQDTYYSNESYSFEMERTELNPSLNDLISCIPKGIKMQDIYLDLELGYDSGRNYPCYPFQGFKLYYTTPFSYEEEMKKYNMAMLQYEKDLVKYKIDIETYKKEMESFKGLKAKAALEKKKKDLQNQLDILNRT